MDKSIEELIEEKKKIEQLIEEKKKNQLPIIINQLYELSMNSRGNKNVCFEDYEMRKYFNVSFNEFIDTIKNSNTFKIASIREPEYGGRDQRDSPGAVVITKI